MGVHDQWHLFSPSLMGHCYGNRFSARIDDNWHTPLLFYALAFHNGREDRNNDASVNTADDPSTSGKNVEHLVQ